MSPSITSPRREVCSGLPDLHLPVRLKPICLLGCSSADPGKWFRHKVGKIALGAMKGLGPFGKLPSRPRNDSSEGNIYPIARGSGESHHPDANEEPPPWLDGSARRTGWKRIGSLFRLIKEWAFPSSAGDELLALLKDAKSVLAGGSTPNPTAPVRSSYWTGHFLSENLQYKEQPAVSSAVVAALVKRQKLRTKGDLKAPTDKSLNSLVAIPGTPGSGKSTFIAHFPASSACGAYIREYGGGQQPVVSALSFNSGMGVNADKQDTLGLRIIYGAVATMGYFEIPGKKKLHWEQFLAKFKSLKDMTALEALDLLRRVGMGDSRRIILLVDEIAFAANDKAVCSQLSTVLNYRGNTDVIVTALSPQYIDDLFTGSMRPIEYCPVPPLPLNTTWVEYLEVAQRLADRAAAEYCKKIGKLSRQFKIKRSMLFAAPVIAAEHPRTIEHLVLSGGVYGVPELAHWGHLGFLLGDPTCTVGRFFSELCKLECFGRFNKLPESAEEVGYLLSAKSYAAGEHKTIRRMLEGSRCALLSMEGSRCRITTSLATLFRLLEQPTLITRSDTLVDDGDRHKIELMSSIFSNAIEHNLSALWERAVALTLAVRAFECYGRKPDVRLSEVFGCGLALESPLPGRIAREMKIKVISESESAQWVEDTLVVGGPRQRGWDIMLCGLDQLTCLVKAKAQLPENTTLLAMLGDKLKGALADRVPVDLAGEAEEEAFRRLVYVLWVPIPLDEVYQIEPPSMDQMKPPSQEQMLQYMEGRRAAATEQKDIQAWTRALRYVRLVFNENVAVIGEQHITRIMPPMLQPIAALLRSVYATEQE